MENKYIPDAIDIVSKAIAADNEGEYENALNLYRDALGRFTMGLKYEEQNESRKKLILEKVEGYMKRAEELRDYVNKQNGTGMKKKGDGDTDDDDKRRDNNSTLQQLSLPNGMKYHVFLTHNWGINEINHKRVSKINQELQKRGIITWFDDDQMHGNISDKMSRGIDESVAVIVFVTDDYVIKVAGEGANGSKDNCKLEFEYACQHKGPDNMIVVEMEETKKPWKGSVGFYLGSCLYHSFKIDSELRSCVDNLIDEIQRRLV